MRVPVRVMHILHTLGVGGLEKGVVNLANTLNSKHFEVSLCCLETSGPFEARLNPGTKVFAMGKSPGVDYILPLRLAKLFRRERATIVHTHNLGTYLYGAIGAKVAWGPRVVHGEHGDLLQTSECHQKDLILRRYLSYMTDVIHTVSGDLRKALVRMARVHPEKIVTILNGVELEKFGRANNPQIRGALGIKQTELVIGTVGRLSPVKNFELLIQALPELNSAGIYPRLVFVGDGPSRPELESLTKQHHLEKQVVFLGNRSDVPDLLSIMDVFVLPSLSEGLSNSILEAMATGLPVVASEVGGNPELVVHNETGFLFPARDAKALAQRITDLARNLGKRRTMGMSGRKRVEEFFTLERMMRDYERLYLDVFYGRRPMTRG